MSTSEIDLHLIGKKYLDTLVYIDRLDLSETNEANNSSEGLGGIYNIKNIEGVSPRYSTVGEKKAVVISEQLESRRTSIVKDSKASGVLDAYNLCRNILSNPDWTHVAYIDDIDLPKGVKADSIDFCTNEDRSSFKERIDNCVLIFDSRERKHLYENLDLFSVIVFHDPQGCEAIFKKENICSYKTDPIEGMHVNGAGDIFAGVFIREFMRTNLHEAVEAACEITTEILKQRQENEEI